jgi:multiple sugar transport system permease protein
MTNSPRILTRLLHVLLVLVLGVFGGFPIYWMATTALSLNSELFNSGQIPWPQLANLPGMIADLAQLPLARWLINTGIVAVGTTALSLVLGALAGYALSRFKFQGKGILGFLMFMTQVVPEALILVPL